jgi:hypothetical protein
VEQPEKLRHAIIAKFFEPQVRDMGGGLRIVELPNYITVEERDFIVRAVSEYSRADFMPRSRVNA